MQAVFFLYFQVRLWCYRPGSLQPPAPGAGFTDVTLTDFTSLCVSLSVPRAHLFPVAGEGHQTPNSGIPGLFLSEVPGLF